MQQIPDPVYRLLKTNTTTENDFESIIPTKGILKTVYTIGNCQRLAFTVGVSQHMHKITNL